MSHISPHLIFTNYFPVFYVVQYQNDPVSWFQKNIRGEMVVLTDHISKEMNELNLIRCQKIPKRPGADWRDLPEEKVELNSCELLALTICDLSNL